MLYAGGYIYRQAWKAFLKHHATMDTLIALGTGAAWSYSQFITLFPGDVPKLAQHVYFEAALNIIAFINLGAALEIRARGKTSQTVNIVGLLLIGFIILWFLVLKAKAVQAKDRVIVIKVQDGIYDPSVIEAHQGDTLRLRFNRLDESPCSEYVI